MQVQPKELLEYIKKHEHTITLNKEDVGPNLVSYNIAPKKEKDDIVYSNEFNRLNLRRGLTFIEQLKDFKRESLIVARKGLRKFNDLYREYLEEDNGKIGKKLERQKARFLQSIENFKGNYLIHLIEKANGQNAQISFSHGYWVISSKNRVMFIENQEQLDKKDKSLFGFTVKIARVWFQYLKTLNEQKRIELQSYLETATLIGQYCDSINHQHIVKYQQVFINFYAIVLKESSEQCLPPLESYQIFKQFCLKTCRIETKECKTIEEFYDELKEQVRLTNKKSIEEAGQGCVIYIAGKNKEGSKTLSLWKVKSVEYRILRKLRQKVIAYLKKDRKTDKLLKKYVEQIKELTMYYQPKNQLEYYIELGRKAFKLVSGGNSSVLRYVTNRFIEFLDFLNKKQGNEIDDFKKLISGVAQEEPQDKQNYNQQQEEEQIEQPKETIKQQIKPKSKQILVIIPMSIPSSGKTFAFNEYAKRQKNIQIQILSSDTIRFEVMTQLKLKNKKASHQQLFDKSTKKAKELFFSRLSSILNKMEASNYERSILFLDKNHPFNALEATVKDIRNTIGKKAKILGLAPQSTVQFEKVPKFYYPFSKEYLLTSLKRVLKRQQHETLRGDKYQRCNIVLSFFNMFRNCRFNEYNLGKYFDKLIRFRMYNQKIENVSEELVNLLTSVLMGMKPGSFQPNTNLEALVDMLDTFQIEQLPTEQLVMQISNQIQQLFYDYQTLKW